MVLIGMALKPVPVGTEDKAIVVTGIVTEVYEAGYKDANIKLANSPITFYINRGLEHHLHMDSLKKMINYEVTIKYPKYWTPLDWHNKTKHVSKLEYRAQIIYSEFES